MRSLIELVIALLIAAVFFVGLGFLLPSEGRIERSIEIERPAIHVYDSVNSLRRYAAWAPWTSEDPDAEIQFSEIDSGVGAQATWVSNKRAVGSGMHAITGGEREKFVDMRLNLGPGRDGTGKFLIEPQDVGVILKMSYATKFDGLYARYKGLYLDSEQGDKLNLALASLKAMLENSPYASDYAETEIETKVLAPANALQLTNTSRGYSTDALNIPRDRQVAIEKLERAVAANTLTATGPQFMELSRDDAAYVVTFDVTVPVDRVDGLKLPPEIKAIQTPGGKFLVGKHIGLRDSWKLTGQTRDKMLAYLGVHDMRVSPIESGRKQFVEYLSPPETLEAQFETNVYIPIE
jgi:hypothetical protein